MRKIQEANTSTPKIVRVIKDQRYCRVSREINKANKKHLKKKTV